MNLKRVLLVVAGMAALGCSVHAASGDSITYEIRVIDDKMRPVSGATVWALGQASYYTELKPADLARLVRRYQADADFVFSNSLHGHERVLRTASDGTVMYQRPDKDVHGLARVRTSFAGLKRGFLAVQVDDDAPINAHRKILLKLTPDPIAKVDPRMDEFDRLRALADPGNYVDDPAASGRHLDSKAEARLRELAAELENDGRQDDAAAIYYNLAYLPVAEEARDPSGGNPNGMADYLRFKQLTRGHPQFEYEEIKLKYLGHGLEFMSAKGAPLRREYLAATEKLIHESGERLWPFSYAPLEWAYVNNGEFEAGCRALRRFHDFDPSVMDLKGWTGLVKSFQQHIRGNGGPAKMPCEIAGVPPP